jgi:alkylation response protein AidB-like acyl-CoA dehydrogenase
MCQDLPRERKRRSRPPLRDAGRGIVLPVFNVLTATCVVGLIEAAVRKTAEHASGTRHSDTGSTLADLPTIRSYIAPALAEGVKQSV